MNVTILIQAMLAPGIMISACGLLLLGMNAKYSMVVNRIRLLNEEKRKFFGKVSDQGLRFDEEVRLKSLVTQLQQLAFRAKLVRNAVFSYSFAVAFFVITSLIIGLAFAVKLEYLEPLVIICFSLGMTLVLAGIFFAGFEALRGFQIISYEIKVDE